MAWWWHRRFAEAADSKREYEFWQAARDEAEAHLGRANHSIASFVAAQHGHSHSPSQHAIAHSSASTGHSSEPHSPSRTVSQRRSGSQSQSQVGTTPAAAAAAAASASAAAAAASSRQSRALRGPGLVAVVEEESPPGTANPAARLRTPPSSG